MSTLSADDILLSLGVDPSSFSDVKKAAYISIFKHTAIVLSQLATSSLPQSSKQAFSNLLPTSSVDMCINRITDCLRFSLHCLVLYYSYRRHANSFW